MWEVVRQPPHALSLALTSSDASLVATLNSLLPPTADEGGGLLQSSGGPRLPPPFRDQCLVLCYSRQGPSWRGCCSHSSAARGTPGHRIRQGYCGSVFEVKRTAHPQGLLARRLDKNGGTDSEAEAKEGPFWIQGSLEGVVSTFVEMGPHQGQTLLQGTG